ncbi:MAG: nucleotidyltransferase domain-containing protein [Candidatus Omnitrophota bacterium]
MLKTTATIEEIGREIAGFFSSYIRVDRLILFGSYGYGEPRKDSDFDIAVISEDFEQMSILEKIELFSKTALMVDSRLELKGYSKQEFLNPARGSMLELIKNKGRVIWNKLGES